MKCFCTYALFSQVTPLGSATLGLCYPRAQMQVNTCRCKSGQNCLRPNPFSEQLFLANSNVAQPTRVYCETNVCAKRNRLLRVHMTNFILLYDNCSLLAM